MTETHRLLSGISGELSNIHVDVEIDSDTKTHELLSGISGELDDVGIDIDGDYLFPEKTLNHGNLEPKLLIKKLKKTSFY